MRTPSSLVPCSNDVHTFLISVKEGWLDPIAQKKFVACLLRKQVLISGDGKTLQKSEDFVSSFYVGCVGNTSLVDAGTPLGATAVVTPKSAGYLLWECCIMASL